MSVGVGAVVWVAGGQMRAVAVAGAQVGGAKVGGRLYAFDHTCTHLDCSLAAGALEGTMVTCRCHGSQFDVTSGSVLRGPAQRPVRSHTVEVRSGELFISEVDAR